MGTPRCPAMVAETEDCTEVAETLLPPVFGKGNAGRRNAVTAAAQLQNGFGLFLFEMRMPLADKFGRQITDLRVSVTDRCNFRCVYCRSANPENHVASSELLGWDEYERLVRILVGLGIRKVRVTGGEPLVRPGVEDFIARLKALGIADLSMTTNGYLLAERCEQLRSRGAGSDQHQSRFPGPREVRAHHPHENFLTRSSPASTPRRRRVCGRSR